MNEVYIRKCSLPKSNLTNCLVYQVERLSSLVANSDIKPLRPLQGQQSTTYKSEYHSFHAVTKELGWLIIDRETTDIIKKSRYLNGKFNFLVLTISPRCWWSTELKNGSSETLTKRCWPTCKSFQMGQMRCRLQVDEIIKKCDTTRSYPRIQRIQRLNSKLLHTWEKLEFLFKNFSNYKREQRLNNLLI